MAWTYGEDMLDALNPATGSGSPEGVITANSTKFYRDTTGGVLYVKITDGGNTGWQEIGAGGGGATIYENAGSPEGVVTGDASTNDLCVDTTNDEIWHKDTGNGNNTGWVKVGSTTGTGSDAGAGDAGASDSTTRYVAIQGPNGDGKSWGTAKTTIEGGLTAMYNGQSESNYGPRGVLRIGPGNYIPAAPLLCGQGVVLEGVGIPGSSDSQVTIQAPQKDVFDDFLIRPPNLLVTDNEWQHGFAVKNITLRGPEPYWFDGTINNGGSLWTFYNSGGGSIADTVWRDNQRDWENYARVTTQGNGTTNYLGLSSSTAPTSSSGGVTVNDVKTRIFVRGGGGAATQTLTWEVRHSGELLGTFTWDVQGTNVHKHQSKYETLTPPTGGWTWTKVSNLDVRVWKSSADSDTVRLYSVDVQVNEGTSDLLRIYNPGYNCYVEHLGLINSDRDGLSLLGGLVNFYAHDIGAVRCHRHAIFIDNDHTGWAMCAIHGYQGDQNGSGQPYDQVASIKIVGDASGTFVFDDFEFENNVTLRGPGNVGYSDDPNIEIVATSRTSVVIGNGTFGGTALNAIKILESSGAVEIQQLGYPVLSGKTNFLRDERGTDKVIVSPGSNLGYNVLSDGFVMKDDSNGEWYRVRVNAGALSVVQVSA